MTIPCSSPPPLSLSLPPPLPRSSILTGKYVHNHHTFENSVERGCSSPSWRELNEQKTIGAYMSQAGYDTAFFGQYPLPSVSAITLPPPAPYLPFSPFPPPSSLSPLPPREVPEQLRGAGQWGRSGPHPSRLDSLVHPAGEQVSTSRGMAV